MSQTLLRLSPRERALIGQRIGEYHVGTLIGTGTTSVVFEAVHQPTGQRVAMKVLLAERLGKRKNVDRFFDEARAIREVTHPGLVRLIDCAQLPDGRVYILMELLIGQSLEERIASANRRGRRLPVPMALRLCRQIAAAMAPVHGRSIVHRDLKPENIIIVPDPAADGGEQTKVLDFGIARFLEVDASERRTTMGMVLGSPTYMSPEQCRGRDSTAKSDVYALGVILYEMLSGHPPFVGTDVAAVMGAHVSSPPPPLSASRPEVPESVFELVAALMSKDPAARPDMADAVSWLGVLLEEQDQSRLRSKPPRPAPAPALEAPVSRPDERPAAHLSAASTRTPRSGRRSSPGALGQVRPGLTGLIYDRFLPWMDNMLAAWPMMGPMLALLLGAAGVVLLWLLFG